MLIVYVLYSSGFDKLYIGYTSDLNNRLISHNKLATKGFTVKFRPWIIIYQESFATKREAQRREKALKSSRGRAFIKQLIKDMDSDTNGKAQVYIRQPTDGSSILLPATARFHK